MLYFLGTGILLGIPLIIYLISLRQRENSDGDQEETDFSIFLKELPTENPAVLAPVFLELCPTLNSKEQMELKKEIKKHSWEAYFLTDLYHPDSTKKLLAIEVLALIGEEKSFWPLMEGLASKSDQISFASTAALKNLETPGAIKNLIFAFREPGKWPPARVADILINKGPSINPFLEQELKEGTIESKKLVIELLSEIEERGGFAVS